MWFLALCIFARLCWRARETSVKQLLGILNFSDDKTELLIIGSNYRQIPRIPDLHVGSGVITPASHVKILGVIMDSNFTMQPHINNIMREAFFTIRELSYYGRFLTHYCAKTLIPAYIAYNIEWITLPAAQQTSEYSKYCCLFGQHDTEI